MISTHKLLVKRGVLQWVQGLMICAALAGCAVPPPEPVMVVPNTGAQGSPDAGAPTKAIFRVIEYPLVEQSTDNPDHPGFANRAMQAVADHRAGFRLFAPVDALEAPNKSLAQHGYQITHSTSAPFSTYVLNYQGSPVVSNISRFWEMNGSTEEGFLLVMETISGDLIAASEANVETIATNLSIEDDRLAYAGSGAPFLTGNKSEAESATVPGAIIQQEIDGKTLALYQRDRLAHLSYAGKDLAFTYDAVVYAGGPESAMFNPGSQGNLMWFYALRDGLWYYVEAGMME